MKNFFQSSYIDWSIIAIIIPIMIAGLLTMSSFSVSGGDNLVIRQLIWIVVSMSAIFAFSRMDVRFLKRTDILVGAFFFVVLLLGSLFLVGTTVNGSQSWFSLGGFSFQPSDLAKLILILLLAKYFSRRHIEIANMKHLLISGFYAFTFFFLIFLQPDFGSALVIFLIWFGMILVSGISRIHLLILTSILVVVMMSLWFFVFDTYQKERLMTFVHPLTNIEGSGYNAYQSTIAVGSGQVLGKGIGFGTQSKLKFLPEYETDFIFAAFSEEWGFVGSMLIVVLYVILIIRILSNALIGRSNFETLFGVGFALMLISHIIINIGMNIGLMPVTGIPLPFMSYGGSHLLVECIGLGILMSTRRYARAMHREDMDREFLGI